MLEWLRNKLKKKVKMYYIVRFVVDVDEKYPSVLGHFIYRDVHVNFKENLTPPNQAEIVLGPYEEHVINMWKERIRGTGATFKMYVAEWDKVKDTNYFL